MSMQPKEPGGIPVEKMRMARGGCPKGSLAIRVRDEPPAPSGPCAAPSSSFP